MGLREDILSLKADTCTHETPKGTVLLRGITLGMKDRIQRAAVDSKPWRGTMLAYAVLDPETGERVFSDDDVDALDDLPGWMDEMVDAVLELSAVTAEEQEELAGN